MDETVYENLKMQVEKREGVNLKTPEGLLPHTRNVLIPRTNGSRRIDSHRTKQRGRKSWLYQNIRKSNDETPAEFPTT